MEIFEILKWLDDRDIDYRFNGKGADTITGFSSLANYKADSITWIKTKGGYEEAGSPSNISCAIVQNGIDVNFDNAILVDNSKEVFFGILRNFWKESTHKDRIGTGTYISEGVSLGVDVEVGCNCTIRGDINIGSGTRIENNVVIQGRVRIGNDCLIHSGTVIGADGFGYYFRDDNSIGKVEHFGGVLIEDSVEIGANTCIDRGTIDDTVVGENSKIDNLVHIAHNVRIGKNVCVVAGAVVCGSAIINDEAYIAPGGIIKNQTTVGRAAFAGLGAVVVGNVDDRTVVTGVPAKPLRKVQKKDK